MATRPSQLLPLLSGPGEPRCHPLGDPCPLELSDGGQDMHLQLARRGRGVDALLQADERHAERLKLIEQRHEVLQAAAQAIQPPTDQDIELAPLDIR